LDDVWSTPRRQVPAGLLRGRRPHLHPQPGGFSIGGEGLCGRDCSDPVTDDYPGAAPHAFTGGTIDRVAVDVSGEPYVDLEREAVAMMSRD
jgi:hypothetical protein